MKKPTKRRAQNSRILEPRIKFLNISNHDAWDMIERDVNITDTHKFYNTEREELLDSLVEPDEIYTILPSPFTNYAITNKGRAWSYLNNKWMKQSYRKNSNVVFLNSTIPLKISKVFEDNGWFYDHQQVVKYLQEKQLINGL